MTDLEQLWISHMVKMGRIVALLERDGGAAIYKSWRRVETKSIFFNVDICYHVWDGKEHFVFQDVREAQKLFEIRKEKHHEIQSHKRGQRGHAE